MPVGLLIGVGSGLVSALLFYSAARGSPLLSTVLLLLTPLPSLLAGLGWGWLPAAAGAVAGAATMAFAISFSFAIGYSLALGLPAVLISYLAYLSRPDPQDANAREWYPAGRLVAAISLYAGSLPLLILPLIGGSYDVLRAPMGEFFRRLSTKAAPELGLTPLNDQQIASLADLTVAALPGALAAYWLSIFALNLYLAGRIARLSGWLGRDWPDLAALTYPAGFPLLVALALAATFMPGLVGVAGSSFTGGLLIAYLLAGLALAHFIARNRTRWLLWAVYGSLILFGPYAAFVLMLGGLLDPALQLRRRFGAPPPIT
jgi:ABC-type transport system involved in multi-copper enzyme maturation permease subunit